MAFLEMSLSEEIQDFIDRLASPYTAAFLKECGPFDPEDFKVLLMEAKDLVIDAEEKRASYPPLRKCLEDLHKYLDQTEATASKITRKAQKSKPPSGPSEVKSEAEKSKPPTGLSEIINEAHHSEMQFDEEVMIEYCRIRHKLSSILRDHKDATKITKSSQKWLKKLATLPRDLNLFKHDDSVTLEGDQLAAYENETAGKIQSYDNMPKQCQEYLKSLHQLPGWPRHLGESLDCFAFCAIFPENYKLESDTLIQLWMAAGLILEEPMEDKATAYIRALQKYRIISLTRRDYGTRKTLYKVNKSHIAQLLLGISSICVVTVDDCNNDQSAVGKRCRPCHVIVPTVMTNSTLEELGRLTQIRVLLVLRGHKSTVDCLPNDFPLTGVLASSGLEWN